MDGTDGAAASAQTAGDAEAFCGNGGDRSRAVAADADPVCVAEESPGPVGAAAWRARAAADEKPQKLGGVWRDRLSQESLRALQQLGNENPYFSDDVWAFREPNLPELDDGV